MHDPQNYLDIGKIKAAAQAVINAATVSDGFNSVAKYMEAVSPCDGGPSNNVAAMPMPKLTTIELDAICKCCLLADAGDSNAQKELEYFSPMTLSSIISELIESRKLLRKVALTLPNDSQPDPIMPIGGGRYVDLSRVQDIEPKEFQVCLTLVSGATAWAPIEMAGDLISAWQAIRRAQVWGK